MTSPREDALVAIEGLLLANLPVATIRRNEILPEEMNPEGHIMLVDGSGSAEILIGKLPPDYSWQWTAGITIAVQHASPGERAVLLGDLLSTIGQIFLDNPRPTEDVQATIVSTELDQAAQPENGVVPFSIATLGVLLEYCTTNPTG